MSAFLYRVGGFCARHPAPVVAIWIVAIVALGFAGKEAGSKASDSISLPGTGSQNATDLLEKRFPGQAQGSSPVVIRSITQGDLTSPARRSPPRKQAEGPREAAGR